MNERSIFVEALDKTSVLERSAFLDEKCASDTGLRRRVEALLKSHLEGGSFLETPVPDRVAEKLAASAGSADTQEAAANTDSAELIGLLTPSDKPGSLGRLGHYEVVEVIGRGGMGIVLRAIDDKLHRVVAIKVMAAQLATSASARKRFMREAQAAAAVSHDHVVTIHAVEEANGLPYLAMQYVSGQSLQQRLDKSGSLELREIVRIGMQMAAGLAAAHAQGLIHRDIKPANILLENGVERVKITDFGLARAEADACLTQTGMVAGTPQYMSPEQARGGQVDRRSDLFSLGSVLYAMCTGRPPFRADSGIAVLRRVCDDTPRPTREINSDIPQWLEAIIAKLHAKDPAQRYQSAAEVAELLSGHLAHLQHPSVAQLPAVERPSKPTPNRSRVWATAAAVLLCLGVGLGLTEAAGVTRLSATVIRIFTPEGTLVVDVDDPAVKVMIEGDGGILITGSGLQEVRLKTGSYKVQAAKNGKPVRLDQELVTITRGDKRVVRVRLEGAAPGASATAEGTGAFVVLAAGTERTFDSLADAVLGASDGDTIEIRGNGPFVCEPVVIGGRSHTIKAGAGFRPVLQFSANLGTDSALVLEGLEFQRLGEKAPTGYSEALVASWYSSSLHIANCRFQESLALPCVAASTQNLTVQNCEFISPTGFNIYWVCNRWFVMDNCLLSGSSNIEFGGYTGEQDHDISVRLNRSTLLAAKPRPWAVQTNFPVTLWEKEKLTPIRVKALKNIFDADLVYFAASVSLPNVDNQPLSSEGIEARLRRVLAWEDCLNLYAPDGSFMMTWAFDSSLSVGPTKLAEWKRFWGPPDGEAIEGRIRYQGGNLVAKLHAAPGKLTPEDFRLRPDSAGYQAGKDGKDLGADIALVGPGKAYEFWQKTPEYQQWLIDSGQVKH